MLTYRVGAAGFASSAGRMADHLMEQTLPREQADLAEYYQRKPEGIEHDKTIPEPRRDMKPEVAEKLGIDPNKSLDRDQIAHLLNGQRADGKDIEGRQKQGPTENKNRNGFIDLCFSADKSVSVAHAFAPTEAERNIIMQAHRDAVDSAMRYIEKEIALAWKGKAGCEGAEPGSVGWIKFDHYTSRATLAISPDEKGNKVLTFANEIEPREGETVMVRPKIAGDPNLHTHVAVPNMVLTESGRVGSLDLDRLQGRIKEFGGIYQAFLATNLRQHGIDVVLDRKTGSARLPAIPDKVRDAFSKRTRDAYETARQYASDNGIEWDKLSPEAQIKFLKGGALDSRRTKTDDVSDLQAWRQQAESLGWKHESVMTPGKKAPDLEPEQRMALVRDASLPFLEEQFSKRAVLDGTDARVAITRGLIAHGIDSDRDVSLGTRLLRNEGVRQDGKETLLVWGSTYNEKGREKVQITTALHIDQEKELVRLARNASADRSAVLTKEELQTAVQRTGLKFEDKHGEGQYKMMRAIAEGGNISIGIGVAGSGKAQPLDSQVLTPVGFKTISELRIGSSVVSPDGTSSRVIGIFPQGAKDIFRVTFEDGRTVECCDEHLWKVWTNTSVYIKGSGAKKPKKRVFAWRIKPLKEIRGWSERNKSRVARTAVPLVAPSAIEFPAQELPIPPYALGALLGDGNFGLGVKFTTADPHILASLMADLPAYEAVPVNKCDYRLRLRTRKGLLTGSTRTKASETMQCYEQVGQRRERVLSLNGESKTLSEWARTRSLPRALVFDRISRQGWSIESALELSPPPKRKRAFSPLQMAIESLGLGGRRSHNKFIPDIYKHGSITQRTSVLQGLLDTDGSVCGPRGTHATFTSTSEQLARDVQWIAWSLGAVAKISERQTHCMYKSIKRDGKPSWRVSIVYPNVSDFFTLPRKLSQCASGGTRTAQRLCIKKIEHVGQKEAACIAVEHPDHLYVTDGFVVTHNTTLLKPLVDAWHAKGYTVHGSSLAWRQSDALAGAGIKQENRVALAAFISRAQKGKIHLDSSSVVVIDELGQVGARQALDLLRLREEHGFKLVALGDPKQCQSIESGGTIELLRKALGKEAVPELLTTVRQKIERERDISLLFREGKAGTALEMKRQDGTVHIVPGGRVEAIHKVADLWEQRRAANRHDPEFKISISAPTNTDAREISVALRERLRRAGELGPDQVIVSATDQNHNGVKYDLPLAVGDRVRLFNRVNASFGSHGGIIGNNGSVLEIRALDKDGLVLRTATGTEGLVKWDTLRDKDTGRIRLTYGYAGTIDSQQGDTSTEHIDALPSGSKSVQGFKAYTAESRHTQMSHLVLSDGAERQEIVDKRALGDARPIKEADIWKNISDNLSRQPEKLTATAFLEKAEGVRVGSTRAMQAGLQRMEHREVTGRQRSTLAQKVQQTHEQQQVNRIVEKVAQTIEKRQDAVNDFSRRAERVREIMADMSYEMSHSVAVAASGVKNESRRIPTLDEHMKTVSRTRPTGTSHSVPVERRARQPYRPVPTEHLKALKDNVSITHLIKQAVALDHHGKGCCPFHKEKTPSFHVDEKKGHYHCFGCGAHGDAVSWLREGLGMSFKDAIAYLEGRTGVTLPKPIVSEREGKNPEWKAVYPVPEGAPPLFGKDGRTNPVFNPKREGTDKEFASYRPQHVASYKDQNGQQVGFVIRVEIRNKDADKDRKFTPQIAWAVPANAPAGSDPLKVGRWSLVAMPDPRPLYHADRLAKNPNAEVIVVFGEKKADALQKVMADKAVVVSWAGGDNARTYVDFSPLKGRNVTIWPDADKGGRAAAVGEIDKNGRNKPGVDRLVMQAGAASVRVVVPPDKVTKGWDAGDLVKTGVDRNKVEAFIEKTAATPAEAKIAFDRQNANQPNQDAGRPAPQKQTPQRSQGPRIGI